ncbi:hypothetical protein ACFO3J_15175 [Streptomyces polygonati]|uniref:Uncharacterized protein n=1 Tax=Streptomyces polygonati TaxID=1617087 RepID=A0ABV8HSE0_9ACTN
MAADLRPADSTAQTPAFAAENSRGEAMYGAEFGREAAVGPPPCDVLLSEFLALMGRIEADFTTRWNAAHLGSSTSARPYALLPGWRQNV